MDSICLDGWERWTFHFLVGCARGFACNGSSHNADGYFIEVGDLERLA